MAAVLGIDTSNYTTSAALCEDGKVLQQKMLLPVKPGELGVRQSDAVFHHVQQLPEVIEALFHEPKKVEAVGVSSRPRPVDGSYMPCFTVGLNAARMFSAMSGVPLYAFSHQEGHIAAALYSMGRLELIRNPFLAFHVSGGTTEAILVRPGEGENSILCAEAVASSLDLKAGQLIDRVGVMLGLRFPCGSELEKLALRAEKSFPVKPSMKGADCSLSGVENQCAQKLRGGMPPEEVARYCLDAVLAALDAMTAALLERFGCIPLVFAGGVMSNSIVREALSEKWGALFAKPEFSSDNAAGIAVLAAIRHGCFLK